MDFGEGLTGLAAVADPSLRGCEIGVGLGESGPILGVIDHDDRVALLYVLVFFAVHARDISPDLG
jgi:hypothetical protein